jgi:hypothetical protein
MHQFLLMLRDASFYKGQFFSVSAKSASALIKSWFKSCGVSALILLPFLAAAWALCSFLAEVYRAESPKILRFF